jgi:Ca2+-binding EF-hand superfamily protein
VLSELNDRERDRFLEYLVKNSVQFVPDSSGEQFSATIRMSRPAPNADRSPANSAPATPRGKGAPTSPTTEAAPAAAAGGGHARPDGRTAALISWQQEALAKRFWRFCSMLPPMQKTIQAMAQPDLARFIEGVFHKQSQATTCKARFPESVMHYATKHYGMKQLVGQKCWVVALSVEQLRARFDGADLFGRFLSEALDMEDLAFFLCTRRALRMLLFKEAAKKFKPASRQARIPLLETLPGDTAQPTCPAPLDTNGPLPVREVDRRQMMRIVREAMKEMKQDHFKGPLSQKSEEELLRAIARELDDTLEDSLDVDQFLAVVAEQYHAKRSEGLEGLPGLGMCEDNYDSEDSEEMNADPTLPCDFSMDAETRMEANKVATTVLGEMRAKGQSVNAQEVQDRALQVTLRSRHVRHKQDMSYSMMQSSFDMGDYSVSFKQISSAWQSLARETNPGTKRMPWLKGRTRRLAKQSTGETEQISGGDFAKLCARLKGAAASAGGWKKLFREQDADANGTISWDTFFATCRRLRLNAPESHFLAVFARIDFDDNGKGSIDELIRVTEESNPAPKEKNKDRPPGSRKVKKKAEMTPKDMELVKKLCSRLRAAAYTAGGTNWAKLMREQDKDKSGEIEWPEFYSMCRRVLKLPDSEDSLRMAFTYFDEDGSGEVSIDELVQIVEGFSEGAEDGQQAASPKPSGAPGSPDGGDSSPKKVKKKKPKVVNDDMLKKISGRMKAAAYTNGGQDWAKLFKEMDKDHDGEISWTEFYSMCRRVLKLTDPEPELKAIFQFLDSDGSGEISIDELISLVKGADASQAGDATDSMDNKGVTVESEDSPQTQKSAAAKKSPSKPAAKSKMKAKARAKAKAQEEEEEQASPELLKKMCQRLNAAAYTHGGKDFAKLLKEQDKDHDGTISWQEFYSMCRRVLKMTVSEPQLKAVFRHFDDDDSGELTLEELEEAIAAIVAGQAQDTGARGPTGKQAQPQPEPTNGAAGDEAQDGLEEQIRQFLTAALAEVARKALDTAVREQEENGKKPVMTDADSIIGQMLRELMKQADMLLEVLVEGELDAWLAQLGAPKPGSKEQAGHFEKLRGFCSEVLEGSANAPIIERLCRELALGTPELGAKARALAAAKLKDLAA